MAGDEHNPVPNNPKREKRDIHTRVYCDDYEFMLNVVGAGYISHEIRELMSVFRKKHGNPREVILADLHMHETEAEHDRQKLLEIDAEDARKEKEEQERNAKIEDVISMLVNASRRHAKVGLMLWQTATEKSGIPIMELKKIVKEKLKESELNEN